MPKGERRESKPPSEAEEALGALDDSIYNMKSIEDTMNWDRISRTFHAREFLTIDEFRVQISQALEAVNWADKGFIGRMMKCLDGKIEVIKARQEKK